MYLNNFIHVDSKIARSVNLERDASNIDQIRQFQVTSMAGEVLDRFINALKGDPETAWSLTGPYGTGKSSFCNFLFALCADSRSSIRKAALTNLEHSNPDLYKKIIHARQVAEFKGFLPLRAVSRYESLNKTLLRSLEDAFRNTDKEDSASLLQEISAAKAKNIIQTSDVLALLEKAGKITGKKLLIVVDEFGKNLEFMSHNPSDGDIFILQALAESRFSYLWVCLHQAFSEYASTLSQVQRNEWQKIQGRFDDISYLEPPSHVINLILRAVRQKNDGDNRENHLILDQLDQWAKTQMGLTGKLELKGLSDLEINKVKYLYPFSPLTAILLGELSHRFAQNDRTIFSFLSSTAPKSFSGFLSTHIIETESPLPTLSLDWLYDYFCEITSQIHGDRLTTQRWIEIHSLITEHENAPVFELKLLKTIGVLNLLSKVPGVRASLGMIKSAMGGDYDNIENSISNLLDRLVDRRIVLYRDYADEYRLWEGSDFDIEKAVLEERARLSLGTLEKMLEIAAPRPSVIAARHSFQTGAVREFKQTWTTLDLLNGREDKELIPCQKSDGQIWLILGKEQSPDRLAEKTKKRPLIIGYAPYENQVIELALDAAAAKKVFQTNTQLAKDGVARREARFRADAAADILHKFLIDLIAPSTQKIQWYACGKAVDVKQGRGISSLVSKVCDQTYYLSPRVHMEMINHNRLTSAAARAQRVLMEAMVTSEAQKDLGLEGFGPEKAIYMALFQSTGLHTLNPDDNIWQLIPPESGNKNHGKLLKVWNTLDNLLEGASDKGKGISFTELIKTLQAPPYGLRVGPIPIFLCHYVIVNDDRIALYQEGVFQPFFGAAEAALMVKRPDLFELRLYLFKGVRREVVQAYMAALDTEVLKFETNTRNQSLLQIIAPLVEFMNALPDYSRFTRRISPNAQKLRGVVLNSREPLSLLFKEIPEALGLPELIIGEEGKSRKKDLHSKLQRVLLELFNAFKDLKKEVQDSIQSAFEFGDEEDFSQFRKQLYNLIKPLEKPCRDPELKTILKTILNVVDEDDRWVRGIAGVVMKKPLDAWRDSDIEPWHASIGEIADRIMAFEALVAQTTGVEDGKRIILSLTRINGKTHRSIVDVSVKEKHRLLEQYPGIEKLSKKEKESLCAILLENTGKKNEQ